MHTLDIILKNQYLELEVHKGKTNWEEMARNFKVTFIFEDDEPLVNKAL